MYRLFLVETLGWSFAGDTNTRKGIHIFFRHRDCHLAFLFGTVQCVMHFILGALCACDLHAVSHIFWELVRESHQIPMAHATCKSTSLIHFLLGSNVYQQSRSYLGGFVTWINHNKIITAIWRGWVTQPPEAGNSQTRTDGKSLPA